MSPDAGWNLVFLAAIGAAAYGLWYGFMQPLPGGKAGSIQGELARINTEARKIDDKADLARSAVAAATWNVDIESLGPTVLERVTDLAQKHHLQLTGFRTDKPNETASIQQAPLVATLEGSYPDVIGLVGDLDAASSKLAVNMLQVTSSDTEGGRVTATIAMLGFVRPPAPTASKGAKPAEVKS